MNVRPVAAKYALADAGLRSAMALLFLVSATTKVTETSAIQTYMHAYGVPGILVWPAACFEYAAGLCLLLGYRTGPGGGLVGGVVFADSADLSSAILRPRSADELFKNLTMAGGFQWLAEADPDRARVDPPSAAAARGR